MLYLPFLCVPWTKRAIEYFLALGIRNLVFYFDGCRDPMKAEEDKMRREKVENARLLIVVLLMTPCTIPT